MKNLHKIAVLAMGAALVSQGAYAGNNDLILGINNNDSGGQNDFIVDLGQLSTFTPVPNYNLSGTITLSTAQLQTSLGSGISGWNAGVIGGQNGVGLGNTGNDAFTTTLRGGSGSYTSAGTETAPGTVSFTQIGSAGGVARGLSSFGVVSSAAANSFSSSIAYDTATPGTAQNSFDSYLGGAANPTANPLQNIGASGVLTLDLWKDTVTGSTPSGWVYEGEFVLDVSGATPSLTFDPAVVPEPSTTSLLVGGGLLALAFGHQLRRKNV